MSSSALASSRKRIERIESSVRNYNLPHESSPSEGDQPNATLFFSLLQSRLNWINSVFVKYRLDSAQQPKRTKKWANMRLLCECTVRLGIHDFPETSVYEAVRFDSWNDLAKAADIPLDSTTTATAVNSDATVAAATTTNGNLVNGTMPMYMNELLFRDIVLEFKEAPGERYYLPKEMIVEVRPKGEHQERCDLIGSFLLPLDPETADDYFLDAKTKLARYGSFSTYSQIREYAAKHATEPETLPDVSPDKVYQPANIMLLDLTAPVLPPILSIFQPLENVREKMKRKMKIIPERSYLKYYGKVDNHIEDLLQKATTVPEMTTAPVAAEKKRSEIMNAVRLGKRPRTDEEFVAQKSRHINAKDDGFRKCTYCSTKHTAMWRPGPEGTGTLCNGCGLLWSRGQILKGALVISKEEEKRRMKEQLQKEKELEEERERQEQEREREREQKRAAEATRKADSQRASSSRQDPKIARSTIGIVAAQILQQQHNQQLQMQLQQQQQQQQQPAAFTVTNGQQRVAQKPATSSNSSSPANTVAAAAAHPNGIPLPTLSIDFGPSLVFVHPDCSVALVENKFSIRLTKDNKTARFEINKQYLQDSKFKVDQDTPLGREILILTCVLSGGETIHHFDSDLLVPNDPDHGMSIKFLEKVDNHGGAVVQRILERWLTGPVSQK